MEKATAELDAVVFNYIIDDDDDVEVVETAATAEEPKLDTSFDENQNPKSLSEAPIVEDTPKKEKDLIILLENQVLSPSKFIPIKLEEPDETTIKVESNSLKTKRAGSFKASRDLGASKAKKVETKDAGRKINGKELNDTLKSKKLESLMPKRGRQDANVGAKTLEIIKPKRGRQKKADTSVPVVQLHPGTLEKTKMAKTLKARKVNALGIAHNSKQSVAIEAEKGDSELNSHAIPMETIDLEAPKAKLAPKPRAKSLEPRKVINDPSTAKGSKSSKGRETKNVISKEKHAAKTIDLEAPKSKKPRAKGTEGKITADKKLSPTVAKKPFEATLPTGSQAPANKDRTEEDDEPFRIEIGDVAQIIPFTKRPGKSQQCGVKYETVEQIHTEFKYESQNEHEEMRKKRRGKLGGPMRGKRSTKMEGQTAIDKFFKIVDLNGKIQNKRRNLIYKCNHCLYVSQSKSRSERHSLIHRNPDEIIWFHCTKCPYKSKYDHQLKSHSLIHLKPDQINFFKCPHCEVKCMRKNNLTIHIRNIHSKKEYSYKCAECDYKTFSKDRLVAHLRKHSKEVHACTLCKLVTKKKAYLKAHFKMKHMEEIPRPFPCDTCSYKGRTKKDLERHYDRVHNKERLQVYECNHCSFNSIYKKNLEFHLLHMHNNSKGFQKFICGHCHKNFSYKNGLKVHIIRCHIKLPDDDWHKCHECKYRSKAVDNLQKHIKRNHGASKLHCKLCSFATNRQTSMEAHMNTHNYDNEDILKCPKCPYRVISINSFRYHMKVIHGKPLRSKEAEHYYMKDD